MKQHSWIWAIVAIFAACDGDPAGEPTVDQMFGGIAEVSGTKADGSAILAPHEPHGIMDYHNDPGRMDPNFERRFDALPAQAKVSKTPWTDTYWPRNKGGIGYRWQTGESHTYASPSRQDLMAMSPEDVAHLSPAEKYDILVGNYNYTLTLRAKAQNSPQIPSWQGYCHGWAVASMEFDEPSPVVMTNPDGIQIPFGSSDVKALLTYFSGEVVQPPHYDATQFTFLAATTMVGSVCFSSSPDDPSCTDINPGAFHILMANLIGLRDEPMGIDATTTKEKWNQPVHTYVSQVLAERPPSANASPNTVREVIVRSAVTYTQEIEAEWEPQLNTAGHRDTTKQYTYSLELNTFGEIVGGQWVVMLGDGTPVTLHEAWHYLRHNDENNDGKPDMSKETAQSTLWQYFDFPDYVYVQESMPFSNDFFMPYSGYDFITMNLGSRERLYRYFAKLSDLYAQSTGNTPSIQPEPGPAPMGSPSYW